MPIFILLGVLGLMVAAIVTYAIVFTAKDRRRTEEAAREYRFAAHRQLEQFLLEVHQLKAGKIQKTTPINGMWLRSDGGSIIYMHWNNGGSECHQQVTAGTDLTKMAEIRLGLR